MNEKRYPKTDGCKHLDDFDGARAHRVIEKNSYSAFTNPLLMEALDCDAYLIAGFYAEGCVNATIVDGWGRGYFMYILSDLVESMDGPVNQEQKRLLLSQGWPMMYGHVMTSGEFLKLIE